MTTRTDRAENEIMVWALDAEGATSFFGFDPARVRVRVLQDAPETPRECERYLPRSKLFGITFIAEYDGPELEP